MSQLRKADDIWWRDFQASTVPYLRPPFGAFNAHVLALAGSLGHSRIVPRDVGDGHHLIVTRLEPGDDQRRGGEGGGTVELEQAKRTATLMVAHEKYDALYLIDGDSQVAVRMPDHPHELDYVSVGLPYDGWHVPDPGGCDECKLWARWL